MGSGLCQIHVTEPPGKFASGGLVGGGLEVISLPLAIATLPTLTVS
jgi:hypothetical protein